MPVVVLPATARSLFTVSSAPATAVPPPITADESAVEPAVNVPPTTVLPFVPSTVKRATLPGVD